MNISHQIVPYKWYTYKYILNNNILTEKDIKLAINGFMNTIFNELPNNQYLLIIFKIKTEDKLHRTISTVQRINKLDKYELLSVFNEYWILKSNNYVQFSITEIHFNYKFIDNSFKVTSSKINRPENLTYNPKLLKCGSFNFPQTMDLYQWGDVQFILDKQEAIVYKHHSSAQYHVKFDKHTMIVKYVLNNKPLITFRDELLDINNLGTFKRTIKNQIFQFVDTQLISKEKLYKFPIIKKLSGKPFLINKFITMDLETINVNGKLIPYVIAHYVGTSSQTFYVTDYRDHKDMLIACIKSLMQRKYNGYKVYLHNFSNFDGIFLFNILNELSNDIKPIINDGNFINIIFKYNNGKYKLYFRDSFLMLPSSLRKLAKSFYVEEKSIFPYRFVNIDNLYNMRANVGQDRIFIPYLLKIFIEVFLNTLRNSKNGIADVVKKDQLSSNINLSNVEFLGKNIKIDQAKLDKWSGYNSKSNPNSNTSDNSNNLIPNDLENDIRNASKDTSVMDSVIDFLKDYSDFLTNLNYIDQVILFNLFALIIITQALISIIIINYSKYLIDRFQLETKYPRVAIYLRYRAKVQYINYIWQVFSISFVLLVLIIMDILLLLRII